MSYYEVSVKDRVTKQVVTVLSMASRAEAGAAVRQLDYFNACDIYITECPVIVKRKRKYPMIDEETGELFI